MLTHFLFSHIIFLIDTIIEIFAPLKKKKFND